LVVVAIVVVAVVVVVVVVADAVAEEYPIDSDDPLFSSLSYP